jgi:hypothetical protein
MAAGAEADAPADKDSGDKVDAEKTPDEPAK